MSPTCPTPQCLLHRPHLPRLNFCFAPRLSRLDTFAPPFHIFLRLSRVFQHSTATFFPQNRQKLSWREYLPVLIGSTSQPAFEACYFYALTVMTAIAVNIDSNTLVVFEEIE